MHYSQIYNNADEVNFDPKDLIDDGSTDQENEDDLILRKFKHPRDINKSVEITMKRPQIDDNIQ
jgi:hypothetical protein